MKKHILLIIAMAFATFSIANAQNRQLRVWKGGSIVQSLPINDIDSLTIADADDDDVLGDDQISDLDFIEATIDGQTKKGEWLPGVYLNPRNGKDKDGKQMVSLCVEIELGRMGFMSLPIALYRYKSDFLSMTSGTYPMRRNGYDGFMLLTYGFTYDYSSGWPQIVEDDIQYPFDASVELLTDDHSHYYSTNGTTVIKSIMERTISFEGYPTKAYTIIGTFSCKLAYYDEDKHADDMSKTKECSGSFQVTYIPTND